MSVKIASFIITLCWVGMTSSTIYSTFPKFVSLPQTVSEAEEAGYTIKVKSKCSSPTDVHGIILSKPGSELLLPGLIYNSENNLAGYVFAVTESELVNVKEDFAPFSLSYANNTYKGQIYWFEDPSTICQTGGGVKHDQGQGRIWIQMPPPIGIYELPQNANKLSPMGNMTDGHWTEHLCAVGMGNHMQYRKCDTQYQFVALYDRNSELVGVVNAVGLRRPLNEIHSVNPPPLIEDIPADKLFNFVFAKERFATCYQLNQSRIFVHVYTKKPEVDYHSCSATSDIRQFTNRCKLCGVAVKSLAGDICQSDGRSDPSIDCCKRMETMYGQAGGCTSQGCTVPATCGATGLVQWMNAGLVLLQCIFFRFLV